MALTCNAAAPLPVKPPFIEPVVVIERLTSQLTDVGATVALKTPGPSATYGSDVIVIT